MLLVGGVLTSDDLSAFSALMRGFVKSWNEYGARMKKVAEEKAALFKHVQMDRDAQLAGRETFKPGTVGQGRV